ncbi:glycosyltransferase family 4 protein [Tengunoibacter tsumagoiensis]|uniref:Glycosyl transferase n=1 Tax=Tengunoibacter tsumagoiensis TaxID=2014871 RepID=A0A402A4Q1_9CHLR|nr:glycosyltransferase family 4 protein [Tengunoibacter tsumagoiensis]GCE14123.1 glycosyl transferase [Tengunoibacter tsumagoiensis]
MKIAQIAPPWITIPPHNFGGTENALFHLIEEQVAQGHEVTLFATADARTSAHLISFIPASLVSEGVPWQAGMKAYYHLHKSIEYISSHQFDIVHTHLSSSGDMYLFPLLADLNTPHVTTLHSHFPFDRSIGPWVGDADAYFMEWARQVPLITISEHARRNPLPDNVIGTVHHGIQTDRYRPLTEENGDYFLWLGRFSYEKGAHLAIEAARRAGVPLVLAGIKEPHKPESVQYYKHMIEPYLDGKQIRYVGPVSHQQKVELLSQARGLLHPIVWDEPFGMVLIEAMATGCPIIATPRGATPEIVKHEQTGFLARSVDEIVDCIPRITEIDRRAVREHAEKYFSAPTMVENYVHIYKQIIASHK